MNYRKIYDSIVERGKKRSLNGYTEMHHIIPRCMGGTDTASNLVRLTPEEHYLCHLLLVKMYPNNMKIVKAAMFMTSSNKHTQRNNKVYGWLRRQLSTHMKGPNNPSKIRDVWNKGMSVKLRRTKLSDAEKLAISKRAKENNPCAGIKPWKHPRATEYSKSVWKNADKLFQLWQDNDKPSYCKLYTLANCKCYTKESKVIGPYMNIVKYFNNGWIPSEDTEWKHYNEH